MKQIIQTTLKIGMIMLCFLPLFVRTENIPSTLTPVVLVGTNHELVAADVVMPDNCFR